ncbi:MAG: LysR family transcriptional regulator [Bacteroidales bacterium]|nr:LysR family transcriptional regulator [Bacteroidales bacterium]
MFDFRLKVFYTAAKHLSFSKAAEELFISQPAISKHVQALEQHFKTKLFVRQGNKVGLTPEGKILFKYASEVTECYKKMQYDMDQLANKNRGQIRIGASTTLTQYILPGILKAFRDEYPDIRLEILNENTEQIETFLLQKEIDLGIIEGRSKKRELKYTAFLRDELVLVTKKGHPIAKKGEITIEQLTKMPLVIREFGSGTLQVIKHYLKEINLRISDLNIEMILGSTEGIKNYLKNSNSFAFLSIHSIMDELKTGIFSVVDYPGSSMNRDFYFITPHGDEEQTATLFQNFITEHVKNN